MMPNCSDLCHNFKLIFRTLRLVAEKQRRLMTIIGEWVNIDNHQSPRVVFAIFCFIILSLFWVSRWINWENLSMPALSLLSNDVENEQTTTSTKAMMKHKNHFFAFYWNFLLLFLFSASLSASHFDNRNQYRITSGLLLFVYFPLLGTRRGIKKRKFDKAHKWGRLRWEQNLPAPWDGKFANSPALFKAGSPKRTLNCDNHVAGAENFFSPPRLGSPFPAERKWIKFASRCCSLCLKI